jgi:hypothetical protein
MSHPTKIDFNFEIALNGMQRCLFRCLFFQSCFFLNTIVLDDESDEHILNSLCTNLYPVSL